MDSRPANLKGMTRQGACIENEPVSDNARLVRYIVCPDLIVESVNDRHIVLCNRETAARLKLSQAAYRLLRRFHDPCRINDIAPDMAGPLTKPIAHFIEKGLLIDADAPRTGPALKLRRAVPVKFCNAPALDGTAPPADFVILGVPYDYGGPLECRTAPSLIRQKSLDYEYGADLESGRPRGWMDVNAGRRILEGATLQDAGDMHIDFGESADNFHARCLATLKESVHPMSCPVILGGDHTVTYPIAAYLQQSKTLAVLRVAPDPRHSRSLHTGGPDTIGLHRKIRSLKNIADIFHFTGECFLSPCKVSENMAQDKQPAMGWLIRAEDELIAILNRDCALYISIDMTLFTSPHGPETDDSAVPGLAWLHPVQNMLERVGTGRNIIGIDIVGLDTYCEPRTVFSTVACHLLLAAMQLAHSRKETRNA